MKNILIIKPSSFGDIIQSNPVLSALKKLYPGCRVTWLVFKEWKDVLELYPGLDGIIEWDRRGGLREYFRVIREIRKNKFDIVIDLQGLLRTAALGALSGAGIRIGVPGMKEFSGLLLKEVFPENAAMNATLRSLETVRYLTNEKQEAVFNITVPEAARKASLDVLRGTTGRVVSIIPFVRGKAKQWPLKYFEELCSMILKSYPDITIAVIGGKNDRWVLGNKRIMDLCGKTSITELAGVLQRSSVVIGADTGPAHLGAAMNIPSVVIFGGSDINETAPVSKKTALISKYFDCSPCRGRPECRDYDCLKAISPDEVFESAEKWLK